MEMAKIKRIVNLSLPVTACNFQCHYCFVGQEGRKTGELGTLQYSPEHIQRAISRERLGGVCFVSICGLGETLLPDYAVEIITRILANGHYVSVVTNGTITKRIKELCELPEEYRQRLFFKFSFHYLELKRLNLLAQFFANVRRVKQAGCSFSLELTVSDEAVPYVDEINEICRKQAGAACHVIESRNNLDGFSRLTNLPVAEHQAVWRGFASPLFEFQQTIWQEKRCEFCYAGEWMLNVDAGSGWTVPCLGGGSLVQNIFENLDEPIRFAAIGQNCPYKHCYAAYVTLSLGAIPDMEVPVHADFRDRVCADGSTWLTPTVREFFSSKLCESNEEYPEAKKLYINALMAFEYNNNAVEYDMKAVGRAAATALQARNIKSLAVWGQSRYTDWLFEALRNSPVKIKYVVDTEFYTDDQPGLSGKLKRRYKYALKRLTGKGDKPLLLNRYDRLPQVDAMVITDWAHFNGIRQQIPQVYTNLLALTELAD